MMCQFRTLDVLLKQGWPAMRRVIFFGMNRRIMLHLMNIAINQRPLKSGIELRRLMLSCRHLFMAGQLLWMLSRLMMLMPQKR